MARKMYETEEHLKNERIVADKIERVWRCKLKKLSYKLMVDFAICKDDIIKGWVEVKCRKISYLTSPDYMISMHKINFARQLSRETELPFFLVVEFNDCLCYWEDKGERLALRWGGINKQYIRDDQDREPCYYISTGSFTRIL